MAKAASFAIAPNMTMACCQCLSSETTGLEIRNSDVENHNIAANLTRFIPSSSASMTFRMTNVQVADCAILTGNASTRRCDS